ncbi:lytic transglycosylase domain-containing protein [Falsiroseomonas sp. HW251]|uniref:lytic transglycosylase domain-containing protein n=1 Tax=Falsiroseomonas sp. HW251 TaxID=3390998 RepID=UPI003D31EF39
MAQHDRPSSCPASCAGRRQTRRGAGELAVWRRRNLASRAGVAAHAGGPAGGAALGAEHGALDPPARPQRQLPAAAPAAAAEREDGVRLLPDPPGHDPAQQPLIALLVLLLLAGPAQAQPANPWNACEQAIAAESQVGLPPGLLLAIARVESGRARPGGGVAPWPFAINAAGESRFAESREAAIAAVEGFRARGVTSVDVGCMQVNLLHHPGAFDSLDAAFDPARNVAYAARFLRDLQRRTGNWAEAIAQYHSGEPGRGLSYHARVNVQRVAAGTLLSSPSLLRDLCARGRRPAVLVAPNGRPRVVCRG